MEVERHREAAGSLQAVSQAVVKLVSPTSALQSVRLRLKPSLCVCPQSRVLSSSGGRPVSTSSDGVLSRDLSSLLSVLSQTESALQWRHEELQVCGGAGVCCGSEVAEIY